jgi:hypothetical protein
VPSFFIRHAKLVGSWIAEENFRVALEKQLRDLRTDEDASEVKRKAKSAVHELADVQVREIQNKVATLKDKGWLSAGVGATSLLTTVQVAGWSLLGVAGAALEGARLAVDYRENVKRHPAFFLWKLLRRKRRFSKCHRGGTLGLRSAVAYL